MNFKRKRGERGDKKKKLRGTESVEGRENRREHWRMLNTQLAGQRQSQYTYKDLYKATERVNEAGKKEYLNNYY